MDGLRNGPQQQPGPDVTVVPGGSTGYSDQLGSCGFMALGYQYGPRWQYRLQASAWPSGERSHRYQHRLHQLLQGLRPRPFSSSVNKYHLTVSGCRESGPDFLSPGFLTGYCGDSWHLLRPQAPLQVGFERCCLQFSRKRLEQLFSGDGCTEGSGSCLVTGWRLTSAQLLTACAGVLRGG